MAIATGRSGVLDRLIEVLGLQNQRVKRVVLVFDIDAAVTAYVQRLVDEEEVDGVTDLIAGMASHQPAAVHQVGGIEVDEKGRTFVPASRHAALISLLKSVQERLAKGTVADAFEAELLISAALAQKRVVVNKVHE